MFSVQQDTTDVANCFLRDSCFQYFTNLCLVFSEGVVPPDTVLNLAKETGTTTELLTWQESLAKPRAFTRFQQFLNCSEIREVVSSFAEPARVPIESLHELYVQRINELGACALRHCYNEDKEWRVIEWAITLAEQGDFQQAYHAMLESFEARGPIALPCDYARFGALSKILLAWQDGLSRGDIFDNLENVSVEVRELNEVST